jgi:hypothetical protein
MPSEKPYRSRRDFLNGGVSLWIVGGLGVTVWPKAALAAPIPSGGDKGQTDWRFCNKCDGLFYDGSSQKGICPSGGGHVSQGFNFELPFNTAAEHDTQKDWRFCNKCNGMFYDGYPQKGSCPSGSGHVSQGNNFVLHHDTAASKMAQPDWRFCNKCNGMFYNGYSQKGRCPAGAGHVAQGNNFVLTHDRLSFQPASSGGSIPPSPQVQRCVSDCSACAAGHCTTSIQCSSTSPAPWACY